MLVTLDQFAGFLKREFDDFEAYTAQLMLDGAASATVEHCGWHIAPTITESVTVDGTGTLVQALPTMYMTNLISVNELGRAFDVSLVDWSENGLMEKRSGATWTGRRRGIATSIEHGYPSTPGWLTTLICAAAGRAFLGSLAISQETAGAESVAYAQPMRGVGGGTVLLTAPELRMLDRLAIPKAG